MFALNFYSTVFTEQLRDGRKTATIRLGDKRDKYETGQVVWLTVGRRFGTRKKVAAAIIDAVEVKALRDVTPREIQRDNPELRRHEELIEFLSNIYGRERLIGLDDTVTVIHFSRVEERMPKLRVGVIGTGFGADVQIRAFLAHPRVDAVAVASGTPGRAREVAGRFEIPHAFDDYREMVATVELDLVSITSPPDTHHPATLAALAHHRHVLCEKPMALNAGQAAEMLREAERRGVTHMIDHELRFNPIRRKIKHLIKEGFIGTPRHALTTVVGTGRADATRPWTWGSDAGRGGGSLGAQGSHQIDVLRFCLA